MYRIDPRVLIIQIALSGLCIFGVSNPVAIFLQIIFLIGCLLYQHLPKQAIKLGLWFISISLLYAIATICNFPQTVTQPIYLLRKLSPLVGVMMLSLKAMTVSELIAGLQKLHCPKAASLALAVALRFIPTIKQELTQIRNAMKTRGIRLNFITFIKSPIMTTEYMIIPFLMRCTKVADELSASAVTRAIENPTPRTYRIPMKFKTKDIVYFILVICTNIGLLLYSLVG